MTRQTVTVEPWCVSKTGTIHGDGVYRWTTSVFQSIDAPNMWGGRGVHAYHRTAHGRVVDTQEEATAFLL